ncbi:hypothetical protein M8L49_04405 [Acinetobacter baumannii]|uniref:hypothetical protein n=6 Tax=Acinetobacter baumannii TaxID=470 RepID=UPI000CE30996|nr:hypothetical protein [Acinetobacter baumannii]EKU1551218.1 hypothetical protein [Acinetobacter baumannii]EKU2690895.1 hypothetical protein [Acinetobacter baumannii]EKU5255699.1 hypothetical protein [Acinetobacter baumannii]EKU6962084.1 hypothetical protein [Acinetobacter baumannii]EKU7213401.1 hypothetical protein [Acinetobacter baumannii]
MDNYKIKVNDEAESKEAQELFFELGYSWLCCGKYYNRIGNYTFITAYPDEMLLRMGWGGDTDKELTLPQLQDLVVLKRNDVKDATHRDKRDESIYLTSDKVIYYWQGEWCKSAINKSNDYENYIANSLTPVPKNQDQGLISGAEAKLAWANGTALQINKKDTNCGFIDISNDYSLGIFENDDYEFRLKPQTIKLELDLPKPFEPKEGEIYYYLKPSNAWGFGCGEWGDDSMQNEYIQYGAWPTKEDVLKVIDQLRKLRGNNS